MKQLSLCVLQSSALALYFFTLPILAMDEPSTLSTGLEEEVIKQVDAGIDFAKPLSNALAELSALEQSDQKDQKVADFLKHFKQKLVYKYSRIKTFEQTYVSKMINLNPAFPDSRVFDFNTNKRQKIPYEEYAAILHSHIDADEGHSAENCLAFILGFANGITIWDWKAGMLIHNIKYDSSASVYIYGEKYINLDENHGLSSKINKNNPDWIWEIFDKDSLKPIRTVAEKTNSFKSCLKLDDKLIVVGTSDGFIQIMDWKSGEIIQCLHQGLEGYINIITDILKLDDHHLASLSHFGEINIWRLFLSETPLQIILTSHLEAAQRDGNSINVHDDWKAVLPELF